MTQPEVVSEPENNSNNNNSKDAVVPPKTPSMLSESEKKEFDVDKKLESIEDFKEAALHVAKEMEKVTAEHKLLQKKIMNLRNVAEKIDREVYAKKAKGHAISAVEMPNLKPVAKKLNKWYRSEQRYELKKEKSWSEFLCFLLAVLALFLVAAVIIAVLEANEGKSHLKDLYAEQLKSRSIDRELIAARKEIATLNEFSNQLDVARKEIEALKNDPTFSFSEDFEIFKFIRLEYKNIKYITTVHKTALDTLFHVSIFSIFFFSIGALIGNAQLRPSFKKMKLRLKKIETGINNNAIETNNIQVALNGQSDHFKDVCKELKEKGTLLNPVAPPAQNIFVQKENGDFEEIPPEKVATFLGKPLYQKKTKKELKIDNADLYFL